MAYLAGSGSYEEMEQYIARIDESMDVLEMSVRTGNAVTDVIVNDKQKAAEKMGIRFGSDFVYPASDRYNAYDIAIIVNNPLHGIGLSNVRRETAKYLGNVDIKVRKNEFSVTVLLQERSNHE